MNTIILCSLAFVEICCTVLSQEISLFHGALFKEIHNVVFYESTVPITFSIPRSNPLFVMRNLLSTPLKIDSCPFPSSSECAVFDQIHRTELQLLQLQDGIYIGSDDDNTPAESENRLPRRERSIDTIGAVLNWCCGVATDEELGAYVKTETDITSHLSNLQDFVHAEHVELIDNTRKMNGMAENVKKVLNNMKHDLILWQESFTQQNKFQKGNTTTDVLKTQLRTTIFMYMMTLSNNYNEIDMRCYNQQLSHHVISKEDLNNRLQELEKKINKRNFTISTKDNELLVTLKIPIKKKNSTISLFHLQSIPLHWNGHTCRLTSQHHLILREENKLQILSDDEEDDCQFKQKGLCLIPRKKMSNSATQATCLHLLTSEADVSELREVCKFDCKATDNQTLITRLREDTFLFHNTGKKTTIRCKNSTTEVPSNSPGTLSLHIPCNCELQDDNGDVLISTLYPCDSRSHPSPAINNLIPHMWTNLSKLSIPIFKHETLPQYLNLSEILNENWHLNFSKFEEHNSFSEDIFHHVEMPNNFDLLGVNNKLIIYIIIVWQTLITVIFLYLCLQNYIKKKANQLRVPKRTPIVDYPQEL
ncbi:uncharacterized protein LOC120351151 isoform X1 [Nilaparvata lugens]|uniref:uncharacterized protein LOC120351151 isoform X1 n=1 Tax=Nilaparvata lugens TaxID=108931 RepID=UPI00193DC056|nr:uncharacterized protein LOC120351151 isoform X1 [Nilaparvata lugens]